MPRAGSLWHRPLTLLGIQKRVLFPCTVPLNFKPMGKHSFVPIILVATRRHISMEVEALQQRFRCRAGTRSGGAAQLNDSVAAQYISAGQIHIWSLDTPVL